MLLNTIDNILKQAGAPERAPREAYVCSACGAEQVKGAVCQTHPYRPAISKLIYQYWIDVDGYDLSSAKRFFDSSEDALRVIRRIEDMVLAVHRKGEHVPYFQIRYGAEFSILRLESTR